MITDIKFGIATKQLPQSGNIAYEYNPFRNYRLDKDMYMYQNHLYTLDQLKAFDGLFTNGTLKSDADVQFYKKGELVDFETDGLQFSLNNPVNILPQYSYDGSVNLILNDGKNIPRLINSRFSTKQKNTYEIVDRSGDEDTNIYDSGDKFDIDTSLYKRIINIPKLTFNGVITGGGMKIGNYNYYFKYADADGNETDYVAESSVVSVFIGNSSTNCTTGLVNENSNKSVSFTLSNIDNGYQYIKVYFTRNTSDIQQDSVTSACKIIKNFIINNDNTCKITITGFENVEEITLAEINTQYNIINSAQAQATVQNRLFLGNVTKPDIPYKKLIQCSLRFLPFLKTEEYQQSINQNYVVSSYDKGYYDPKYIYDKVGYWDQELYRIGIVYIMKDNSLSPVFNIRGHLDLPEYTTDTYTSHEYAKDIKLDETNYILDGTSNTKGVISFASVGTKFSINSLDIRIDDQVAVLAELKNYVKGFFFVRQKRIPTILCQALTIGIDRKSHTPLIPVGKSSTETSLLTRIGYTATDNTPYYIAERFLNDDKELDQNFQKRVYVQEASDINQFGAICPEYDVNSEYFNSIFNGEDFQIEESKIQPLNSYFSSQDGADIDQHFYINSYTSQEAVASIKAKVIGVEDGVELNGINNTYFSTRAGNPSEAVRFEYLNSEIRIKSATNLLRGDFGPILGIVGYNKPCRLINIRISGYSSSNIDDYVAIRANDKTTYQAISERLNIDDITDTSTFNIYRGDCYICQFTHRVNRNFQDPSAPTNDTIVDKDCWKNYYDPDYSENFEKINLGDLNAIQMGTWVTFKVRSSYNLNIRTLDSSNVDETAITGHSRGFYPYLDMNTSGNFKTQEALCYNKGFVKSLSERWNFEMPNVPYIKNVYENRICYSNINVNDAFKNGFRVFELSNYRDYPKTYGSIIKLLEVQGNLLCVFEHGICLIPVNERAIAASGSGGDVFINTSNVLPENPRIISDKYGSQWADSIIKTPYFIYGLDAVNKKIWRTDGERLEIISDFKVQKFLNDNITLTERELTPIMGIRNIKTHYNAFKNDVMFTFYDNLYGFNEKVWNLCYNEILQKFVTFYSWIPSYSDNIYNEHFSFNRDVSKWIAKLGVSKSGNDFSNGIVLSDNIIKSYNPISVAISDYILDQDGNPIPFTSGNPDIIYTKIGDLSTSNIIIPNSTGNNIKVSTVYSLQKDIYNNYKNFSIFGSTLYLKRTKEVLSDGVTVYSPTYQDLISEFYVRVDSDNKQIKWNNSDPTFRYSLDYLNYSVYTNSEGLRVSLDTPKNSNKIVKLLNIKVEFKLTSTTTKEVTSEQSDYMDRCTRQFKVNAGQYEYTIALLPEFNEQFLTSDFWKHGQSGSIDTKDAIKPCYWYGKQHPFEFEVVVADNPGSHKMFDNLEIVSNAAQPESFHYEIIGDCFDFAKDKVNMFVRQEVTKDFYQSIGSDITYDTIWTKLNVNHEKSDGGTYKKSTMCPLYYARQDTINEVEDYYKQFSSPGKDYSNLSGAEITYDGNSFKIWNHCKAVEIQDSGRLRGNMNYQEDTWDIVINPIIIVQKNEDAWTNDLIPITIGNQPVPNDINTFQVKDEDLSQDLKYAGYKVSNIDNSTWGVYPIYNKSNNGTYTVVGYNSDGSRKEIKVKDKFVKIRVRYSGSDLAIISALKTFYSISYA